MVTSLPTDQEVSGTIAGSAMGFLFSGELFHDMFVLGILFQYPLSMLLSVCLFRTFLHSAD